mmetsp:Transcript_19674/g.47661  ORF Transcript_19674/g.47661 Transcript_19674/m.47661 type:complete len:225 (+) Transcript_19674:406-1080(+)
MVPTTPESPSKSSEGSSIWTMKVERETRFALGTMSGSERENLILEDASTFADPYFSMPVSSLVDASPFSPFSFSSFTFFADPDAAEEADAAGFAGVAGLGAAYAELPCWVMRARNRSSSSSSENSPLAPVAFFALLGCSFCAFAGSGFAFFAGGLEVPKSTSLDCESVKSMETSAALLSAFLFSPASCVSFGSSLGFSSLGFTIRIGSSSSLDVSTIALAGRAL